MANAKSWHLRKKIVMLATSIILLLAISFFGISVGYAYVDVTQEETDSDDDGEEVDNGSSSTTISSANIMEMLDQVFISSSGTTRIADIFGNGIVSTAYEIMQGFSVLAFCMACIIKALQNSINGGMTPRSEIKFLLTVLCGLMLILYLGDICDMIYNIGINIILQLRELAYDSIGTGSFGSLESSPWLVKVVSRICFWIAKFIIVVPCWMLLFEACIRRIFLPLAAADLVTEGWRSPGVRYLKTYLGIFINIAMAYAIAALMCMCLTTLDDEGALIKFLSTIGIIMGGSRLIVKSQKLINEALGV